VFLALSRQRSWLSSKFLGWAVMVLESRAECENPSLAGGIQSPSEIVASQIPYKGLHLLGPPI
jgi:hypothetical protein